MILQYKYSKIEIPHLYGHGQFHIKEGRRVISIVLIQKDKQCTKKSNTPNMKCLSPLKQVYLSVFFCVQDVFNG